MTTKFIDIKHVLVFEVFLTGHHPIYLQKIVEAYLKLGHKITVVISEKHKDHFVLNELSQQYDNILNIVTLSEIDCTNAMQSKFGDVGREIGLWRLFKKAFQATNS